MLTAWASQLNPVITNPITKGIVLKNVQLAVGQNVINHKLGRILQGWNSTRIRNVAAQIYDTQDSNQTPQLTLNLVSDAAVTVDLFVF